MIQTSNTERTEPPAAPEAPRIIGVALGVVVLLALVLMAFAWPTSDLEPRSLPLAIAAPSGEAADAVEAQLAAAFGVHGVQSIGVTDREAAVAAIEDRQAYGAIVIGQDGAEVLTATAASPLVAQLLRQTAQRVSTQQDLPPASVTDVVPATGGDPSGAIFGAGALPLALGGLLVGAVSSLLLARTRDRVAAALLAGVGGGLAYAGILQGLLSALDGSYWANAAVIALGILAVALPTIGLHRLLDRPGVAVVAVLVMLVGNPLSGVTSAPELLPLGWLGQLLPPGATATALRGTAYFDGAGTGPALMVLLCWSAAGLVLTLVPRVKPRDQAERDSSQAGAPANCEQYGRETKGYR